VTSGVAFSVIPPKKGKKSDGGDAFDPAIRRVNTKKHRILG
jgi:hypothetical protein